MNPWVHSHTEKIKKLKHIIAIVFHTTYTHEGFHFTQLHTSRLLLHTVQVDKKMKSEAKSKTFTEVKARKQTKQTMRFSPNVVF